MTAYQLTRQPTLSWVRQRLATPWLVLGVMIAGAAAVRVLLLAGRTTPRYLPDEYLYPELARSLASGDGVAVLGQTSAFPALLEPMLLAPIWAVLTPAHAITATQAFHACLMALAAIPTYRVARRLNLGTNASLACASVAAVAPGLFFSALLTADALGYLLALIAVAAGVSALTEPSRRAQLTFVAVATLATFARLEYAALFAAYLIAVPLVEREARRTVRNHALVLGYLTVAGVLLVAAGAGALGRYATVSSFSWSSASTTWALSGTFILAAATGISIAPSAVGWAAATLAAPSDRPRLAFAAFSSSLVVVLLCAASLLTAETGSERFLERYVIVATPLVAIGFACWATDGRSALSRWVAIGLSLGLIVAIARLPLSRWTAAQGVADSPTLLAASRLERVVGVGDASLIAAGILTAGALIALAAAWTHGVRATRLAAVFAGVTLAAISFGAHFHDGTLSDTVRHKLFLDSPSWVEPHLRSGAMLVQTPWSSRSDAMLTILMNPAIERADALDARGIESFDGLVEHSVAIDRHGSMRERGIPVRQPVVWALGGTAAEFVSARQIIRDRKFTLVIPRDTVRLAMLGEGIDADGGVSPTGRLTVYPLPTSCNRLTVRLAIAEHLKSVTIETFVGPHRAVLTLTPGHPATAVITSTRGRSEVMQYRAMRIDGRPAGPFITAIAQANYRTNEVRCEAQAS